MQVVHQVQVQANVYLRQDSENGGHLLELPGLPRQDKTEGCFTLPIVGDDEGGYPAHKKIAHVDKKLRNGLSNLSANGFYVQCRHTVLHKVPLR
jgi:hypothetical protein